jgi:hypothetical protein
MSALETGPPVPKIITRDMPVFMGLINDLFPAIDVDLVSGI